jgi:hypothetical protein
MAENLYKTALGNSASSIFFFETMVIFFFGTKKENFV